MFGRCVHRPSMTPTLATEKRWIGCCPAPRALGHQRPPDGAVLAAFAIGTSYILDGLKVGSQKSST